MFKKNCLYIYVDNGNYDIFQRLISEYSENIEFIHCVNYHSTIKALKEAVKQNVKVILDLDYDLGEDKTGYDIAHYVVDNKTPLAYANCHSINLIDNRDMERLFISNGYEVR